MAENKKSGGVLLSQEELNGIKKAMEEDDCSKLLMYIDKGWDVNQRLYYMNSHSSTQRQRQTRNYRVADVVNILDQIDPNDSDIEEESTDDEDYETPENQSGTPVLSESSDEDEPVPQPAAPHPATSKKKNAYKWTKSQFVSPDAIFRGKLLELPDHYELPSPINFLYDFLTDDMLDMLSEMSNQYSVEKTGKSVDTDKTELKKVIGMFLRMGLAKMPGNRCYWESDTRYEPVASVMSRNRFQLLLTSLHFVNNNTASDEDKKDKLWKIRPWLEKFRHNCLKLVPEEQNSIDEMMIPFKGKFSKLKQYVKGKPHPWGIKVWARTGAAGILYDFDVYQGNREGTAKSALGVGADVVLNLAKTLPQNTPGAPALNYKITADNFFTGLPLIMELKSRGIHYTGTVRPNRLPGVKLQTESDMKKRGRGTIDSCVEESGIVAVRWYDTRAVTTLSTYCGTEPANSVRRYDKSSRAHVNVLRPAVIKAYNEDMGGVDLHDCFVAKGSYRMKSKRWYLYIFWHTIRMMTVNAWLSYRRVCKLLNLPPRDVLNQRKFQARLSTLLIDLNNGCKRKRGRPSVEDPIEAAGDRKKQNSIQIMPAPEVRRDMFCHFMIKADERRRCRVCGLKSNNVCEKCKVNLCYTEQRNCFREFHVRL